MATPRKRSARSTSSKSASRAKRGSVIASLGRWGTALAIVVVLALVGSGFVTIKWSDGQPSLAVNPDWKSKLSERLQSSTGQGATNTKTPPLASIPASTPVPAPIPNNVSHADTIKIASFNIQVFGTSKLKKPNAMNVLTQVIRQFDVIAIQEVRSVDDGVLPAFVKMINSNGERYDFVIGPRLGRTHSKEQYAFIFNTDRIEVDAAKMYTTADPQDLLHREPLVARFRVRGVSPDQAFTFSLVNIHTDPDETKSELNALADVFQQVQQDGSGEDDVIVLGDLNVDEHHLGNLGRIENIAVAIAGVTTNTRRNKSYDNIVFDQVATTEYGRRSGVLDLMSSFQLTEAQALEVSDHCPIWAEFSVYETPHTPPFAMRPKPKPR